MKKLILTSPIPPSVNSYLQYKIISSKRRRFVQIYSAPKTVAYEKIFIPYVKKEIEKQKWIRPEKGNLVFVKCTFYLERKRKDPNNLLKVPFDCLTQAGVYIDDDIALPIVDRLYIDAKNPRIEIEIYEAEDLIGIFNKEEYSFFLEDNCSKCKKIKEKCTIYKAALDNRITENIENGKCLKRR